MKDTSFLPLMKTTTNPQTMMNENQFLPVGEVVIRLPLCFHVLCDTFDNPAFPNFAFAIYKLFACFQS